MRLKGRPLTSRLVLRFGDDLAEGGEPGDLVIVRDDDRVVDVDRLVGAKFLKSKTHPFLLKRAFPSLLFFIYVFSLSCN